MHETTHTERHRGAPRTLWAKVERFVNGLRAEEQAHLRTTPTAGDARGASAALTAKLNRTDVSITDEEWSTLHRLLLSTANVDTAVRHRGVR